MSATFTHTTIDGVRYGIDADGRVLAPDADGTSDQLTLGTVARHSSRIWVSDPGADQGIQADHDSRLDAIRRLARHAQGVIG